MDENQGLAERFDEHRPRPAGGGLPGAGLAKRRGRRPPGAAGVVVTVIERPSAVVGFIVSEGKIVEIDAIADPPRVRKIAASRGFARGAEAAEEDA
jgi:hypothetical protein